MLKMSLLVILLGILTLLTTLIEVVSWTIEGSTEVLKIDHDTLQMKKK